MNIVFSLVNGHLFRASRANNPELAGFGDTKDLALANLLLGELALAEERLAIENCIRTALGKSPIAFVVH